MTGSVFASAGPPEQEPEDSEARPPAGVTPGNFARSARSEGVDRPPSIHEIETHREHIRLNLENWEKQWADVLRYERAVAQDDANLATIRRALTRAGASLALAISLFLAAITDVATLMTAQLGSLSLRDLCLLLAGVSATVMISSLWYAGHLAMTRYRFRKSRTGPLLPPTRLDAVQILSSLTRNGDPLYYRERDVDEELGFGWRHGFPSPPEPRE